MMTSEQIARNAHSMPKPLLYWPKRIALEILWWIVRMS